MRNPAKDRANAAEVWRGTREKPPRTANDRLRIAEEWIRTSGKLRSRAIEHGRAIVNYQ